ncbi:hypothetical protein NNO04_19655, partial [Citrobacter sp. Awk 4]|uniref:hypothetical protein n=1 Tax=Citrobacter sp. Awk 4 TaxID=2963955 RepID=UPI002304BE7E
VIIALIIIVLFLCGLLYYHHQAFKPFRCDAQVISHIEQDGIKIDLNVNTNIIITLHDEATFYFAGSLKVDEHEYIVNRTEFVKLNRSELNGIKKTKITHSEINKNDTLPEEIWVRHILPRAPGTEFYTKIASVNSNGVLFQVLSNPLLICVRNDN